MKLGAFLGSSFGLGVLVVACSSGGGGGATDASSFADQYCDLVGGTCCPKSGKTYNQAQCVAFFSLASAEGGQYNAVAGTTCLNALQTATQEPSFCTDLGDSDDALQTACQNVYTSTNSGTKQPGEACTKDSDCAPSAQGKVTCETHFTSGSGGDAQTEACQVTIRAKAGGACNGDQIGNATTFSGTDDGPTSSICWAADNLYCDDVAKKCATRVAVGAACTGGSTQCVDGARCDFTTQKCVALAALGAACTEEDSCVATAYCDTTGTKTCTAILAPGTACTSSAQCGSGSSCTNQKCTTQSISTAFICAN